MKPGQLEAFGLGICSDCKGRAPLFRHHGAALCRDCHPRSERASDA